MATTSRSPTTPRWASTSSFPMWSPSRAQSRARTASIHIRRSHEVTSDQADQALDAIREAEASLLEAKQQLIRRIANRPYNADKISFGLGVARGALLKATSVLGIKSNVADILDGAFNPRSAS